MRLNRELILEILREYARLGVELGRYGGLGRRGLIVACESEPGLAKARHELELLRGLGGEGRALSAEELRARLPRAAESLRGGVYFPEDAHLDPERFVLALARRAVALGARIETGQEVLGLETSGRRISRILATRGDFRADQVVLAAGAWSPELAGRLGLRLPVQAAKGYSVTVRCSPDVAADPVLPVRSQGGRDSAGRPAALRGHARAGRARPGGESAPRERHPARRRAFSAGPAGAQRIETWRGLRPLSRRSPGPAGRAPSRTW
jgi:D-amino-acid dehydrogenase